MSFRPNYRSRVYRFWEYATRDARTWGQQTGRKYRVSRFRDGWIVRPTTKRATVISPVKLVMKVQ